MATGARRPQRRHGAQISGWVRHFIEAVSDLARYVYAVQSEMSQRGEGYIPPVSGRVIAIRRGRDIRDKPMCSEISLEISAILSFVREPDYKDYHAQYILLTWDYIPRYAGFSGTIALAWGDRWTGEDFSIARKSRWRFYIDSELIETEFAKILERFADPKFREKYRLNPT